MAKNHGGEEGVSRSLHYAAMHSLAFEDTGELPIPSYMDYPDSALKQAAQADIVITLGCRGEVAFNALRVFSSQTSKREDYDSFLQAEVDQRLKDETLLWLEEQDNLAQYENLLTSKRPFRSKIRISSIHSIARHKAGYYLDELDIRVDDLSEDALETSIQQLDSLLTDGKEGIERNRALEIKSIRDDHEILLSEIQSRLAV